MALLGATTPCVIAVALGVLLVNTWAQQQFSDEPFVFDQFKDLKFFVTHRGGLIVPGKVIRGGDASCVMASFEDLQDGNFTYIIEFTENGVPRRITHPAIATQNGFTFLALSGGVVNVEVLETDYSNYAIVIYSNGELKYPIVMATTRMASTIIRQRFMELTGGSLVALEVIDNRACVRN